MSDEYFLSIVSLELLGPYMWGRPVEIHSETGGFRIDSGYDGYSRTPDVEVLPGYLDADLYEDAGGEGGLTHEATANGGGYVLLGVREGYTLMNKRGAGFLGSATSLNGLGNVRATAWADIGYTAEDRTEVFNFDGNSVGVSMKFIPRPELALVVEVDGDGNAACAGYIVADEAGAYYSASASVMLTAEAQPGYVFKEWSGEGTAFITDGGKYPDVERALDDETNPITDTEIWVEMKDADDTPKSRTVTATFDEETYRKFDLLFRTFISVNNFDTFLDCSEPLDPFNLKSMMGKGDDRTFTAAPNASYRTEWKATLEPNVKCNSSLYSGLSHLPGITEIFAEDSIGAD